MASSETEGIPALVKSRIRAYLLSCTDHKEPLYSFEANYGKMYKAFKPSEFGFTSLRQMMESIPDAVKISNQFGQIMFTGVPLQANKHIVNMIDKQKKPKKPKGRSRRDIGIFPRYQHAGYRQFKQTQIPRNAVFPPPPYQTKPNISHNPPASKCPPLMHQPSSAKKPSYTANPYGSQKSNFSNMNASSSNRVSTNSNFKPAFTNTRSVQITPLQNLSNGGTVTSATFVSKSCTDSRFYQIPQRANSTFHTNKENDENQNASNPSNMSSSMIPERAVGTFQDERPSVFDRLGPLPSATANTSNSTIPKPYDVPSQSERVSVFDRLGHQNQKYTESHQVHVPLPPQKSRDSGSGLGSGASKSEARPNLTKTSTVDSQPTPTIPQPSNVIYVDLMGTAETSVDDRQENEGQMFSCDDSDFLKRLVRYLLANLDKPESRIFTAAGITTRMQRQLSRNSIDIPVYMQSIIYEFLSSSWDDCFVKYGEGMSQETTEFTFIDEVREAYRHPVRELPEQVPLTMTTMHTVKITHVASPAFYVKLCSEDIVNKYNDMVEKLKDFIEGDEPEDIFTYRANELCAVYIKTSNRFMRARLRTYRIKASQVDQSNIQLSLVAVIFLIDTGEEVTIPAGDLYALPNYFHTIPPFAYRCIFSGAHVMNQERFHSVMNSHVDKEVDLKVAVQQKSVDGLVLQVRVFASSYLMDDLVLKGIMSKITISEPEPKRFPINKDSRVRFVDWHQGYRTILVQRWSDEELEELNRLEKDMGSVLLEKNMNGLRKALVDNFYIWLQPNGSGRRVRCRHVSEKRLIVQCLDHGCRCHVDRVDHLFFPDEERLISAFSQLPFMATSIPLAMIPEFCGDIDVLSNRNSVNLKKQVRELCPTHTIFQIRYNTQISESQAFMLRYEQNDESKPSVNIQFLKLFMDMRNWPVGQRFCASLSPLDVDAGTEPQDGWHRWIARFDTNGCSPNFGIPLQDYRFMESCCLQFTSELPNRRSLMTRLSDLSASEIVDVQTRLVLLQGETEGNTSRAVRVTLTNSYLSSRSDSVNIRFVDNPMDHVFSVEPHQLFTFPKTFLHQVNHYKHHIDIDMTEINHFRELLQNLPPLDQVVLTSSPLTCDLSEPLELEIVSFEPTSRRPVVSATT